MGVPHSGQYTPADQDFLHASHLIYALGFGRNNFTLFPYLIFGKCLKGKVNHALKRAVATLLPNSETNSSQNDLNNSGEPLSPFDWQNETRD
jgi:hypothetical protein